jgi:hypothetical protein
MEQKCVTQMHSITNIFDTYIWMNIYLVDSFLPSSALAELALFSLYYHPATQPASQPPTHPE